MDKIPKMHPHDIGMKTEHDVWFENLPIICMMRYEFEALPEYSCTWPTGVTPGKRWRRHDGVHDFKSKKSPVWFVLEYGPEYICKGPEHWLIGKPVCDTIWYKPIISREAVEMDIYLSSFDATKYCCFCGAFNRNDPIGYAGERVCSKCGNGGQGERNLPNMAYMRVVK